MTTNININVGSIPLVDRSAEQQRRARGENLETKSNKRLERKIEEERNKEFRKKGKDKKSRSEPYATFERPRIEEDPIVPAKPGYYWLATRDWIFSDFSDNGIEKTTKVTIRSTEGDLIYDTWGSGFTSIDILLNNKTSQYHPVSGKPYLPEDTAEPGIPYIDEYIGEGLDKAKKTLEVAEPGISEFDPTKYILHHENQLPVFDGDYVKFYKVFYNIYCETFDFSKVYFAAEPKKFTSDGKLVARKPAVYHGKTLEANDSCLFSASHAYLMGRYEAGTVTIRPAAGEGFDAREIHVFITRGRDRNGFYSLGSTGTSRFAVNDVVYLNNYNLTFLEPQLYRHGTILEILRGTFTYTAPGTNPQTFSGLRLVIRLSTPLTLNPDVLHKLNASTIVKVFEDTDEALASQDAFWEFRNRNALLNGWITETLGGQSLALPALGTRFVGDADLNSVQKDCSSDRKAYFYQSFVISKDFPVWNSIENYFDGDTMAQRPGTNGTTTFQEKTLIVKFFELNCASNTITRSELVEKGVVDMSSNDQALFEAMPSWFPSREYRLAGYSGELNLTKSGRFASRLTSRYDIETDSVRYYIKYWPIDTAGGLTIAEKIEMIQNEESAEEIEVTDSLYEIEKEISISENFNTNPWGTAPASWHFVSK